MRIRTIAALAAVALTGCGSDEAADAPSRSSRPATATGIAGKADRTFAAKADAICAEANAKEAALGAEGPGWMYGGQFDDVVFLEQFVDAGRVALRELKKLSPPPGARDSTGKMLASLERMVKALDSRADVLRDGRDETRAVRVYESGYTDLVTAAGSLGLNECQGVLL